MDEKGEDINKGNVNVPGEYTKEECLAECKKERHGGGHTIMTACEWKDNKECIYHTFPVVKASGDKSYECCIFNKRKYI